jgi:hypothetical protein
MSSKAIPWVLVSLLLVGACGAEDKLITRSNVNSVADADIAGSAGRGGAASVSGGSTAAAGRASAGLGGSGAAGAFAAGAGFSSAGAVMAAGAGGASVMAAGAGGASVMAAGAGGASAPLGGTSGSAGSLSMSGAPGVPAECQPGAKRCEALAPVLQTCSSDGRWQNEACPFVCQNGACVGACRPGDRQCSELQPQRCNDFGEFVVDGPACAAQCEEGACTGMCRNGATQCASGDSLQTCVDGAWSTATACEFTCVSGACGGECEPGKGRCASSTETETCSSSGEWANRTSCPFVCVAETCGGECKTGEKRCSANDLEVCDAGGEWALSQACSNACVNKACGGVCKPGAKRCGATANTLETCDAVGQWIQSTCPGACANNSCVSCAAGAKECTSSTMLRACGANNEWGQPTKCDFACVGTACTGSCVPGTRECTGGGAPRYRVCTDQGTWSTTTCNTDQSCKGGVCGSFPKLIFVTSKAYDGNLGGLEGADTKCQSLAKAEGLTGTFRAFLGAVNQPLVDRMNTEGGPYVLTDKSVVAYNFRDLDSDTLHAVNLTETGDPPPPTGMPPAADAQERLESSCDEFVDSLVWVNSLNMASASLDVCQGFTTAGKEGYLDVTYFGSWIGAEHLDTVCSPTRTGLCKTKAPLFCIQQ